MNNLFEIIEVHSIWISGFWLKDTVYIGYCIREIITLNDPHAQLMKHKILSHKHHMNNIFSFILVIFTQGYI